MTEAVLEKKNSVSVDEDMNQYLREIGRFPLLTPEQELELAKRCADGDEEAIRTMVNSNLRLVVSIVRDYRDKGIPLPDLIQEGSIGLLVAARKFDYSKECRFSTYATKWIRQSIGRFILNYAGLIRVPRQTMEKMRKILAIKAAMIQEDGEEPTAEQIALRCDESAEKVRELLSLVPETCSLDAPTGDNDEGTLRSLLEDIHASQPYEELVRQELNQNMEYLMGMLDQRQQQILRLRFGMEDGTCHSFASIGQMLEISKERVRQIERQALDKLQKNGADLGLEDFLK